MLAIIMVRLQTSTIEFSKREFQNRRGCKFRPPLANPGQQVLGMRYKTSHDIVLRVLQNPWTMAEARSNSMRRFTLTQMGTARDQGRSKMGFGKKETTYHTIWRIGLRHLKMSTLQSFVQVSNNHPAPRCMPQSQIIGHLRIMYSLALPSSSLIGDVRESMSVKK